jgi:AcrR family transcriptional regulator
VNERLFTIAMRIKDEEKRAALFEATVKTVNEVGFVAAAVSKIAKEAGVSPATLYIYYENKEDLLISTYIEIKKNISRAIFSGFDASLPIRDILKSVWLAMRAHISNNPEHFRFTQQFANSPYHTAVNRETVEQFYTPIIEVLKRGIEQKIIKDVELDILYAFMFYPLVALSNPRMCSNFELTEEGIETAFRLAWDAIKL